jgi:hypothetical protein
MLLDSTRTIVGQPNVKLSFAILEDVDAISCRHAARGNWLRGRDLNPRPSGYEPDELPGCSTPRFIYADKDGEIKFKKW